MILNYIEHFFILASCVTGCVSISVFASLIGIPIGFANSVVGIQICAITARLKSITQQLRRKEEKR